MRPKVVRQIVFAFSLLLVLTAADILAQKPAPPGLPPPRVSVPKPAPPKGHPPALPTPSPGNPPAALTPPAAAENPAPANQTKPMPVPPPRREVSLPPQAAENALFTPGVPNLRDLTMAVPSIEVWRAQSNSPQKPARRHRRFEQAYLVGKDWAMIRLRFHPLAAGQAVWVRPGPGVTITPPNTEFRVERNGECVVTVAMDLNFSTSDITVTCAGVRTKVPLSRAPLELVQARETPGRSGR